MGQMYGASLRHTHSVRGCVVITWDLTNDSSCTTCATEVTALEYVPPENGLRKVAEKGRATSLLLLENQLLAAFHSCFRLLKEHCRLSQVALLEDYQGSKKRSDLIQMELFSVIENSRRF